MTEREVAQYWIRYLPRMIACIQAKEWTPERERTIQIMKSDLYRWQQIDLSPRQWYRQARRVLACYQDALHGGILESDQEEKACTRAEWYAIPKQYRQAARRTPRPGRAEKI